MSTLLFVKCNRIDCDEAEHVELDACDGRTSLHDLLPDGWDWITIYSGDRCMRCPAHLVSDRAAAREARDA